MIVTASFRDWRVISERKLRLLVNGRSAPW